MMREIFRLLVLFSISLGPMEVGFAVDSINMDVIANVDRYGDGSMKINFHLSATQWVIWKQQYGDHPDVLWRDLKQQFAKYELEKFDLQKNEVDRTATVDIGARAFTHVRSDGTRGIEIPKDFRLVSNSGREWIFDYTTQQSPYSPIFTQINRVILPAEATGAHIDQPGSGSQQLVYEMPENSAGNSLFLWSGISAIGVGILLGIRGLLIAKKPAVSAPATPAT